MFNTRLRSGLLFSNINGALIYHVNVFLVHRLVA